MSDLELIAALVGFVTGTIFTMFLAFITEDSDSE
jgi:hypothetical protein